MYIYEQKEWPRFKWDIKSIHILLAEVRYQQGKLLGKMETLGFSQKKETALAMLTQDVLKTSEIEGENLDPEQVRSSVARKLGMDAGGITSIDKNIEGIVEIMFDATQHYEQALTKKRLFGWHSSLFSSGYSGLSRIKAGKWRDDKSGPMQVISGPIGREKVHYQAPPAEVLDKEMKVFIKWFNQNLGEEDLLIKSALSHLWFVSLHPFEDGNGRIARALSDMCLAKSERSPQRFYSMSSQIRRDKQEYYEKLERTQKGDLDITVWLDWYLNCLRGAITHSEIILKKVLNKSYYWKQFSNTALNERQVKVINKLLDDFEGNLTTSKWAKLCKCSQDTAYRDILDLISKNILTKELKGGRSTHYVLVSITERTT